MGTEKAGAEQTTLYGIFPSGPYADQQTADLIIQARRKALEAHDIEVITCIAMCRNCHAQGDDLQKPCSEWRSNMSTESVMARYPALVAHIIAESLGYATPSTAADILRDAIQRKENWCEWIYSCYARNPRKMLEDCVKNRHHHTGYMSEYKRALALVLIAIFDGKEPLFAGWW